MVHTELTRAEAARRDRLDRERPTFDAEAYESGNVIERSCNVLKQWRGLATRYDRLALTYRGGFVRNHVTRSRGDARSLCAVIRRCPSSHDPCMIRMSKH